MKFLGMIYLLNFLVTLSQQSIIKGKYEMQFEEEFVSQNCIVYFNNNTYERKLSSGNNVKGEIEYSEKKVVLKDQNSLLQMEFFKRELHNDTIYFKTKDLTKEENKKEGIIIYSGKMIRLKGW